MFGYFLIYLFRFSCVVVFVGLQPATAPTALLDFFPSFRFFIPLPFSRIFGAISCLLYSYSARVRTTNFWVSQSKEFQELVAHA